ncbi:MAG: isopeptide-forming domain-containing fimbrial protein, partial [Chloroflexota bacterium]|nr:isopeptide-forming domain-containing fimbrial protein [Chloroflexota bacterium]
MSIGKTAVSTDHQPDTDIVFDPNQAIMTEFHAPGGSGIPFDTVIKSSDLSSSTTGTNVAFDLFDSTMTGVDGGDLVKYTIVIENRGHSANGAFDLVISDLLPSEMMIPAGSPGLNLQVYNGAGEAYTYTGLGGGGGGSDDDIFYSGIQVDDPSAADAPGACQAHDADPGKNIIIITYDLMVRDGESLDTEIENTASLENYGAEEGGENFLEDSISDDAVIITNPEPGFTKELTSTELDNANNGATEIVIGEILTYTLTTKFFELDTQNASIVDTLDSGLAFVDLLSVTNSNSTDLTSTVMAFDGSGNCTNCGAGQAAEPTIGAGGSSVTFDFGDMANANTDDTAAETITIIYRTVATNVVTSDAGDTLSNSAVLSWEDDGGNPQTLTDDDNNATILEPDIVTAKTAIPTSTDAGNTVTYTVTLTNGNGATDTDAYDVEFTDTFEMCTTPADGSLIRDLTIDSQSGPATFSLSGDNTAGWVLSTNTFDLPQNTTTTVDVSGTVSYCATPGQVIENDSDNLETTWTSLSGDETSPRSTHNTDSVERTGADGVGGALNDYASTDDEDVTITTPVNMKYLITTSEVHTDDSASLDGTPGNERPVAIGEIIRYRLVTTIPQGISPNFQVNDRLPAGLIFMNDDTAEISFVSDDGITSSQTGTLPVPAIPTNCNASGNTADSITPASLLCTLADENIARTMSTATNLDGFGSGDDPFFKLGDLVNNDNDADSEYVVIEFNALVHNSTTNQNNAGTDRLNHARVYIDGVKNGDDSSDIEVNIVEPHIVVDKNIVTPANDAGAPMVYRISITNDADTFFGASDAAPAFDLNLSDALDSNLNLQSITIYADGTNGSSDLSGATSCGSTTQTITNNSTLGVGGTASIDLTCLNAGETVVVDVNTVVIASAPAGYTIPNSAIGTGTSLPGDDAGGYDSDGNSTGSDIPGDTGDSDGERDGSDTTGEPNDYYDSHDADHQLDMPVPVKSIVSTSETHTDESGDGSSNNPADTRDLVVGEIMRYRLAIQLPKGTSTDFVVEDIIPAGLSFISGTLELEYLADVNVTNVDATANTDLNGANSGAISLPATYFTLVGQALTISLESPINNDSNDGNTEYVILEFNVLVNNDATNQNTTVHDNDFDVTVGAGANR